MPIITPENVTEITNNAGQLPAAPEGTPVAAPSMFGDQAGIASAREHWKSSFANIAAQQKIDPREYDPKLAEHMAKFDQANPGWKPPSPEAIAEAQHASVHAVNPTASPDQFKIQWPADFVSDAKHLGETTAQLGEFAAAMKFTPEVGRSVLERLAVLSSTFRGMSEDQATTWKLNAEQALKSMYGDQADAKLQAARKAFEIAGPTNKLAKLLGESLQVMDLELVVALTGHADRWAAFSKKGGKS